MVSSGMVLGLGTGSTARYAVEMIGERLRDGRLQDIVGVPTSKATEKIALEVGIPLTTLREHPVIDLTVDGADEVDPHLVLIKGLGGALVREKIVARASRQVVIIVDESKLVQTLGSKAPLPVEVIPFGWGTYLNQLRSFGCEPVLRMSGTEPYISDGGNYIVDCRFERIENPAKLECALNCIPGVVDNGLFVGLASLVIVASESGVRELRPSGESI
ncbi:MAG: ribose-5-phosphate isomerase RpiA [Chloroflexi bacterium]|nr:ribose-5-phosphate isomerase RpiA [Chloroflexota bacterium]